MVLRLDRDDEGQPRAAVGQARTQLLEHPDLLDGACVELRHDTTWVAMRDSKVPDGPELIFTPSDLEQFLSWVKSGDFDLEHPYPSSVPIRPYMRELSGNSRIVGPKG